MQRTAMLAVFIALAACAPKAETPKSEAAAATAGIAPDVAAAQAAGTGDPRVPTVDPASITDASPVGDVMHAYVIPGSETLFAAETEGAPSDATGWAKLRTAAQDVITGAQLLKASSRSKGPEWDADVDTVIKATKVTAGALAKNNADDLVFSDGDMMAGCTACHQKFRDQQPPEGHLVEQKN
ncbi:MAG: hypothetical protein EON61_11460 [Alphaproteobacteria bacterium]|jgi:hypothetical protein|nr:MAG: hypothetical protein EON61_11460 [Alphaproteobacteria bacterium]